jgi:hypothetical protein
MTDSVQTKLKIIVECAVRPVRASISRKRRLREELVAHVTAVFEDELTRTSSSDVAIDRATKRFGSAAELARQLQAAVPRGDFATRLAEHLAFRPGESSFRRAVRYGLIVAVLDQLLLATICMVCLLTPCFTSFLSLGFVGVLEEYFAVGVIVTIGLVMSMQLLWQAWCEPVRNWPKLALLATVASLITPAAGAIGDLLVGHPEIDFFPRFVLGISACASLIWLFSVIDARTRQHQEWTRLPINAEQGAAV